MAAKAPPAGLEPATYRLEGGCSIRLSYGGSNIVTDARRRTESDPAPDRTGMIRTRYARSFMR
jgi:hypothetical protein